MYYEGTPENEITMFAWLFGALPNSTSFMKNNPWCDRLAYQGDAVVMVGHRHGPPSLQDKELHFAEFKDYGSTTIPRLAAACSTWATSTSITSTSSMGSTLRLWRRTSSEMDSWSLYRFRSYVLQCIRGLAERAVGPYYKHREGVRYIHDFYVDIVMGDVGRGGWGGAPVSYPDQFHTVNMQHKPMCDM